MTTALGFRLPRTYDNRPRIWFEALETRRLFSVPANSAPLVMLDDANHPVATVQLIDGVLNVVTGDGVDDVMLGTAGGHPDQLFVHVNGVRQYFSRAGITAVSVDLGAGDDGFGVDNFDEFLNLPTTVNGGAGDDSIGGENEFNYLGERIADPGDAPFAPVHLIGGEGNDTLVGGIGDTVAEGGAGNDLMYGRKGLFTILDAPPPASPIPSTSGSGDDILPVTFPAFANDPGIVIPVTTVQQPPTTTPAPVAEPQLESSGGAAARPTSSVPTAPSGTRNESILRSERSLLDQHSDELW
jgi:Ca2+-binding RTX toxin-like protein